MSSQRYLAGKVTVENLPLLPIPTAPEAPVRKRLDLPQGELAQIRDGDEPIRYLAAIELRADSVRGHHYHERKREFLYVVDGAVELTLEDTETRERTSLVLNRGDLAFISPGIAHALRTMSPGWAIEFAPAPLDTTDSHRYRLD